MVLSYLHTRARLVAGERIYLSSKAEVYISTWRIFSHRAQERPLEISVASKPTIRSSPVIARIRQSIATMTAALRIVHFWPFHVLCPASMLRSALLEYRIE